MALAREFQRPFALPGDAAEIVLVRHGSTGEGAAHAATPLLDGQSDPPLTEEGRVQSHAVSARLSAEPIAALFVTDLRRTAETARPLADATGVEPVVVPDLREVHLGDWERGEFEARIRRADPLVDRLFREQRWDVVPNAEPMERFARRVGAGLRAIADGLEPGCTAVAFVHGAVIAEACRQTAGSRGFAFLSPDNGSVTRLVRLGDGSWMLRSFNETSHLPAG